MPAPTPRPRPGSRPPASRPGRCGGRERPRHRRPSRRPESAQRRARALPAVLSLLGSFACADAPALLVGPVSYAEEDLRGLPDARVRELAAITALGLAVSRGEVERLGEAWVEERREELLVDRLRAEIALRRAGADEETLRARYRTDPRHELVVRHLVVLTEGASGPEEVAEARRRAEAALERIEEGEDFATVAGEVSDEPGAAERGGLLEPGREGTWVPEFWEAASALEEGEWSGVVESPYGFHVIRLEERRVVPFDEVRDAVVMDLATLVPGGLDAARQWTDSVTAGAADPAEGRRLLLERAGEMGLEPPAAAVEAARREWRDRATRWGFALGFGEGMGPEEVADAALDGLGSSAQGARIAREEMAPVVPILLDAYPVGGSAIEGGASASAAAGDETRPPEGA